jgi:hypothetical protein
VTNVLSPFLGKKTKTDATAAETTTAAPASTPATATAATPTAASARSLSDMMNLAETVLNAIESFGQVAVL